MADTCIARELGSGVAQSGAPSVVCSSASFASLTERYYPPVLRYLRRQTGDADLADDLAQETFVAAFRHMDQLRDEASFPGWIFQIARNQYRAEYRRRRLRAVISLDWLFDWPGETEPALERPDLTTDVACRDDIQRTLDQLGSVPREALLLHALGGFGGSEVARILGISHEAARKRINRAEAGFRDRYRALTGEEDVLTAHQAEPSSAASGCARSVLA